MFISAHKPKWASIIFVFSNVVVNLFTSNNKAILDCTGATEVCDLLEVLDSDYVAVEETTDLQLEFGRFKLCFFNEGYYEVKFDDIRQTNI